MPLRAGVDHEVLACTVIVAGITTVAAHDVATAVLPDGSHLVGRALSTEVKWRAPPTVEGKAEVPIGLAV